MKPSKYYGIFCHSGECGVAKTYYPSSGKTKKEIYKTKEQAEKSLKLFRSHHAYKIFSCDRYGRIINEAE